MFDTPMLSLALHQTARIPVIPGTNTPITQARERIEFLVSELSKDRATILIPTPCLAEFLIVVDDAGPKYIQTIDKNARFEIASFDERAAIEASEMYKKFKAGGDKRGGATGDWQKIKVDQQVVAIAKVNNATCIYSADRDIPKIAAAWDLSCVPVWDLPLPPDDKPLFAAIEGPV